MFSYEKKLEYPVKIARTDPKLAAVIISQYGGPKSIRLRKNGRLWHPGAGPLKGDQRLAA